MSSKQQRPPAERRAPESFCLGKRKDGSLPQNFDQLQPRIDPMTRAPGFAAFFDGQSAAAWCAAWRSLDAWRGNGWRA
jgi:hypothetical protein